MSEKVDNLMLEQARLIREDLRLAHNKIDDLGVKVDGHTAILTGLGKYVHDIDERVERLEEKPGVET